MGNAPNAGPGADEKYQSRQGGYGNIERGKRRKERERDSNRDRDPNRERRGPRNKEKGRRNGQKKEIITNKPTRVTYVPAPLQPMVMFKKEQETDAKKTSAFFNSKKVVNNNLKVNKDKTPNPELVEKEPPVSQNTLSKEQKWHEKKEPSLEQKVNQKTEKKSNEIKELATTTESVKETSDEKFEYVKKETNLKPPLFSKEHQPRKAENHSTHAPERGENENGQFKKVGVPFKNKELTILTRPKEKTKPIEEPPTEESKPEKIKQNTNLNFQPKLKNGGDNSFEKFQKKKQKKPEPGEAFFEYVRKDKD